MGFIISLRFINFCTSSAMVLFIPLVSIGSFQFAHTIVKLTNITTLLALGVFSKFKFPVVFSLLIPLSYFPYWLKVYDESMWVILLEYSLLWIYILYEWKANKPGKDLLLLQNSGL